MSAVSVPRVPGALARAAPRRTHPRSVLAKGLAGLPSLLPALLALLVTQRDRPAPLAAVLPLAFVLIVVLFVAAIVSWRRTTYRLGAEDIRLETGLLSRTARSVPFERIQDVSLEQGVLARLLGLVEVRFDTGAGKAEELKLQYLAQEEGERLRELVRERREGVASADDASADKPEGALTGASTERVLFAMDTRRLLTLGLFKFSLVVVGVVAGAVQQFDWLLPFDPYDLDGWQQRLAGPGAQLAGLGVGAQALGATLALLGLLLVGVVSGVVRTALKEWNFTLSRNPRGFRRRRGLLTRTDTVMPAHRVQAVEVSTRPVRRLWGWHRASFVSLGNEGDGGDGAVAPLATLEEIAPLAAEAGFALPPVDLHWRQLVPAYAVVQALRSIAAWLLATGVLAAIVTLLPQGWWSDERWLLVPLLLGAGRAAYRWCELRHQRYGLGEALLYRAGGWLAPFTTVAHREKLHSAEIDQGPLGRRLGYATLRLGLAGGTFAIPALPPGEAEALRAALLADMTRRDFSAMV